VIEKDRKIFPLREGVEALEAFIRSTAFGGDRERPHVGQRWTFTGERGRQALPPLTLRDLGDRIVQALCDFPGLDAVDLDALAMNVLRHIEERDLGDEWLKQNQIECGDHVAPQPAAAGVGGEPCVHCGQLAGGHTYDYGTLRCTDFEGARDTAYEPPASEGSERR
jgi:hypothetical protein